MLKTNDSEDTLTHNTYSYRSNGLDYTFSLSNGVINEIEEEEIIAEKNLEQITGGDFAEMMAEYISEIGALNIEQYLMTDADGNIVVNTDAFSSEYYVEGSAYAKFNGSSIEIGYDEEDSEENGTYTTRYKMTWSGVNATTVEIPDEVRSLEAEAEWSDYVSYNGVSYRKMTDADGSEYYVVDYNPDGVPIEETINTLPVRQ